MWSITFWRTFADIGRMQSISVEFGEDLTRAAADQAEIGRIWPKSNELDQSGPIWGRLRRISAQYCVVSNKLGFESKRTWSGFNRVGVEIGILWATVARNWPNSKFDQNSGKLAQCWAESAAMARIWSGIGRIWANPKLLHKPRFGTTSAESGNLPGVLQSSAQVRPTLKDFTNSLANIGQLWPNQPKSVQPVLNVSTRQVRLNDVDVGTKTARSQTANVQNLDALVGKCAHNATGERTHIRAYDTAQCIRSSRNTGATKMAPSMNSVEMSATVASSGNSMTNGLLDVCPGGNSRRHRT